MWLASHPGGMGSEQACAAKPNAPTAIAAAPRRNFFPNERMPNPPALVPTRADQRRPFGRAYRLHMRGGSAARAARFNMMGLIFLGDYDKIYLIIFFILAF